MLIIEQNHFYLINKFVVLLSFLGIMILYLLNQLHFIPILIRDFLKRRRITKAQTIINKKMIGVSFMDILKLAGLILLVVLFIFSCSSDTPFEAENNPPPNTDLSQFSEIQKQIFTPSCAVFGCHAGANPQAGLNLSSGQAHVALVDVISTQKSNLKRVAPGNSADSYLIHKLMGTNISGARMPLGGAELSPAAIDSIAKWIDKGALNN